MTSVQRDSDSIRTLHSVAFFLIYPTEPSCDPCLEQTFILQAKGNAFLPFILSLCYAALKGLIEANGSLHH